MSVLGPPKPESDLPVRFVAAVMMIAVASVAVYFGGWIFRLLVWIGAAAMLIEWTSMHRIGRRWSWLALALLAVALGLIPELLFPAADRGPAVLCFDECIAGAASLFGVVPAFGAIILLGLVATFIVRRIAMGTGFVYIAIPAFALLVLSWSEYELVFWLLLVTWATDICAYFTGRSVGGPKLAPRISPNKTWAGLVGGIAGAALMGWLAAAFFAIGAPYPWLGALMGLLAQIGDLFESWVKRRAGVKDSGTLLPGHGGVLDRLDGLLPVTLATLAALLAEVSAG
ncbi:MAG: phosphatidate cytidylyltransferase [Sphingomonadaceae bacterium]